MRCRGKGAAKEECLRLLKAWYRLQDPALIRSSPPEVYRDIANIVDWAYRVELPVNETLSEQYVSMTVDEILCALSQHSKAARKIYFCLAVREKANHCSIATERLAASLSLHPATAQAAIEKMCALGQLQSASGKCIRREDGSFYQKPKAYYPCGNNRIRDVRGLIREVRVPVRAAEKDGISAFYCALGEVFDLETLVRLLTRTEMLEYLQCMKKVAEGCGHEDEESEQAIGSAAMEMDHRPAAKW